MQGPSRGSVSAGGTGDALYESVHLPGTPTPATGTRKSGAEPGYVEGEPGHGVLVDGDVELHGHAGSASDNASCDSQYWITCFVHYRCPTACRHRQGS